MPSTLYNPDGSRTGLRINASVRRKRYMGGGDQGPLSTRPTANEQWAMHERNRARADAAAMKMTPPAAPPERTVKLLGSGSSGGQLVPGPSGSAVWKTNEQIKADAEMRASRAAARRKGVNMTPAPGPQAKPQFTFPKLDGGRPRVATFERFKI